MKRHPGVLKQACAAILVTIAVLLMAACSAQAVAQSGDYNFDGLIDAADFTVWGDTQGAIFDLRADGDANGIVDATDRELWVAAYMVPTFSSPPAVGGPQLTVTNLGPNSVGNLEWSVRVLPNAALFTDSDDTPDRGLGGTVAAEVAFEVLGSSLVSASKNAAAFPFDNPGDSPFAFGAPPSSGLTMVGNRMFAALGSDFFTSGDAREMLRIETLGTVKTTIAWSGVYGPNGNQGLLAQNGATYSTSGDSMFVPEPSAWVLVLTCSAIFASLPRLWGRVPAMKTHRRIPAL